VCRLEKRAAWDRAESLVVQTEGNGACDERVPSVLQRAASVTAFLDAILSCA